MEVILKEEVENLGSAHEMVTVKPGYGRNYLIPRGLAILATASAKKVHAENMKQRAHKEAKILEEAQALAEKLADVTLTVGAKAGTSGRIFGSVNSIQIAEAFAAQGFDVDRRKIKVKEDAIKELGTYEAQVKLHREVNTTVKFEVVAD